MPGPVGKVRNLILVHHLHGQGRGDFDEIAAKVEALEPTVAVYIARQDLPVGQGGLPGEIWARPTLTVSFQWPQVFRPKRGMVYTGRPLNKLEQIRRFALAGVPVPRTGILPAGGRLNRNEWGDLVILKPSAAGLPAGGCHTFLVPTERAVALLDRMFPAASPVRKQPIVVQRFIDTGEHPCNFRVLCLFGEPLHCMEHRLLEARPPLDASEDQLLAALIVSNAVGRCNRVLVEPPDVLEFARQAARAMPAIPLQGIDIIREAGTGKLFALENNAGGNTWHFSSRIAEEGLKMISREQRMAQFGAWDVAARVLAERTVKEAR